MRLSYGISDLSYDLTLLLGVKSRVKIYTVIPNIVD